MSLIELFAIAVALSMDAFAVAVCAGCALRSIRFVQYARMSIAFGFFQFIMPVIGWFLGLSVRSAIEAWDHWIAFALLVWIGGSMIRESMKDDACSTEDPTHGKRLLVLAVATSIDALAVGLSFSLLKMDVWGPASLIGVVCAMLTIAGLIAGKLLAHADVFGRRATLVGGCVLVGIGMKILYEHGAFFA